ncbi:MAG: dihydropteroate synthase [Candidatus Marinimicrobia bacterium]|nr:dihydropteroate synthase [Candidatus Neomarinimicrobiota bacterium]
MKPFKLSVPAVMGILNITPDSFYDGGRYQTEKEISTQIDVMVSYGAQMIDIGAESSRPGSTPVSAADEINRISSVIPVISKYQDVYFSIDTWKVEVAEFALKNGFRMLNDITGGGSNGHMFNLSKEYDVPVIIMHMLGKPEMMQQNPKYLDLIPELIQFFSLRIEMAKSLGVSDKNIILDPGIGFGKSVQDNFEIINSIDRFAQLGYPVLIGASRKSFLRVQDDYPKDRLGASITTAIIAVRNGASIVRVHDVSQTVKSLFIYNKFNHPSMN